MATALLMIHSPSPSDVNIQTSVSGVGGNLAIYQPENSVNLTPDQRTIVCRNVTPLGTKIPKRVCHSKEKWKEIAVSNKRVMERFESRS